MKTFATTLKGKHFQNALILVWTILTKRSDHNGNALSVTVQIRVLFHDKKSGFGLFFWSVICTNTTFVSFVHLLFFFDQSTCSKPDIDLIVFFHHCKEFKCDIGYFNWAKVIVEGSHENLPF